MIYYDSEADFTKKELLRLLDTSVVPEPGSEVKCLLCGSSMEMPLFVGVPDQICGDCLGTYKDCATVVCARCRATIGRVPPGPKESGYVVRPREVLHVDKCNVCDPDIVMSKIVEIERWMKTKRMPRKIITGGWS